MCVQENIEFSRISQRPRLGPIKISGDISLAIVKQFPGVAKRWHSVAKGVAFSTPCHPLAIVLPPEGLNREFMESHGRWNKCLNEAGDDWQGTPENFYRLQNTQKIGRGGLHPSPAVTCLYLSFHSVPLCHLAFCYLCLFLALSFACYLFSFPCPVLRFIFSAESKAFSKQDFGCQ